MHNIYPTNILLAKIGVAINNKCNFCTEERDFIEHFFYDCPKIKSVWKRVQDKFFVRFNKQIQISQMVALLGLTDRNSSKKEARIYLNHLILIAKMCVGIYRYNSPIHIDCLFERECNLRKLWKLQILFYTYLLSILFFFNYIIFFNSSFIYIYIYFFSGYRLVRLWSIRLLLQIYFISIWWSAYTRMHLFNIQKKKS